MTRSCIVTGGGTGLGRAITHRLASDGDAVAIVGRTEETLREAATEINRDLGREAVTPYVADLRDPGEVEALVPHLVERGGVDVLVTNAGGTAAAGDTLADVAQQWLDSYRLNVLTAVLIAEALLPHLRRPGGRIVAMSSVSALKGAGSYGAVKAALNNWVTDL
ncbi:MAG: SDR family NAD(P)-dependent oxidoreductase, partial [Nocardioides sp.]